MVHLKLQRQLNETIAGVSKTLTFVCTVTVLALILIACEGGEPETVRIPTVMQPTVTSGPIPRPVIPTYTPTLAPSPTLEPSPTPSPSTVPTETQVPTPEIAPTSTPTSSPTSVPITPPTATSIPTATPIPIATPTPSARNLATYRLGEIIPWFENPPDREHAEAVEALIELWTAESAIAESIALVPWVVDGIETSETAGFDSILRIARSDASIAMRILALSWFIDGVSDHEADAMRVLFEADPDSAGRVLENPWVKDGLTVEETGMLEMLLLGNGRNAQEVLGELPWVADGIDDSEYEEWGFSLLEEIVSIDPNLATSVIGYPWLQDRIDLDGINVLYSISSTLTGDLELGRRLASLSWVVARPNETEISALAMLGGLATQDSDLTRFYLYLPWIVDGVTDSESAAMFSLLTLVDLDRDLAEEVAMVDWMVDGVSAPELEALNSIVDNFLNGEEVTLAGPASTVVATIDEASSDEATIGEAHDDGTTTAKAIDDKEAVEVPRTLEILAEANISDAAIVDLLGKVPWVADGIAGDEAQNLNLLLSFAGMGSEQFGRLLDLQWIVDGIDPEGYESDALAVLSQIAKMDPDSAAKISSFIWINDGFDKSDASAIQSLGSIGSASIATLAEILDFPWTGDDLTDPEVLLLEQIAWFSNSTEEHLELSEAFMWIADDVSYPEYVAAVQLLKIATRSPAIAEQVARFEWIGDGIDDAEREAIEKLGSTLHSISKYAPGVAGTVAGYPWIVDGLNEFELSEIDFIGYKFEKLAGIHVDLVGIAAAYPWMTHERNVFTSGAFSNAAIYLELVAPLDLELARWVGAKEWVSNGLSNTEQGALQQLARNIVRIAERDAAFASEVARIPWASNGASNDRNRMIRKIHDLFVVDPKAARTTIRMPWVDAETLPAIPAMEGITKIATADLALFETVAALPWVDSEENHAQWEALQWLGTMAERDLELAHEVVRSDWVVNDMSRSRADDVSALTGLAGNDPGFARRMLRATTGWTDDVRTHVLNGLFWGMLINPEAFHGVTRQPWFVDGLDQTEALFAATVAQYADWFAEDYDDMRPSEFVRSAAIPLRRSEPTTVWAIKNTVVEPGEDITTRWVDAARFSEDFMQIPFPSTDMIVTTVANAKEHGMRGAGALAPHITYPYDLYSESNDRTVVLHETAHFYLSPEMGHAWLTEGGADLVASYKNHLDGILTLSRTRKSKSFGASIGCLGSTGLANLDELIQYSRSPGNTRYCEYSMGQAFLITIWEIIGHDAVAAALAELHVESRKNPEPDEERVYEAFMRHAPAATRDDLRAAYVQLHGGGFLDQVDEDTDPDISVPRAIAHEVHELIEWADAPPDRHHAQVLSAIIDLWRLDADFGRTVAGYTWVQERGADLPRSTMLADIVNLARIDIGFAKRIAALPNLNQYPYFWDQRSVRALSLMFDRQQDLASHLADYDWISDGLTNDERIRIEFIVRMLADAPETSFQVSDLDRLNGYLSEIKTRTLVEIRQIEAIDTGLAWTLVATPLVSDSRINETDRIGDLQLFEQLAELNIGLAETILGLSWTNDGLDRWESAAVKAFLRLGIIDLEEAMQTVTAEWVVDGIDEGDRKRYEDLPG